MTVSDWNVCAGVIVFVLNSFGMWHQSQLNNFTLQWIHFTPPYFRAGIQALQCQKQ
jgi:hypothetical protein